MPLVGIFVAASALWPFARPYAARSLDERAFFDPLAIAANLYLLLYGLAVILLAISWVNLSAKRFRDRDRVPPVGLAGLLPLVVVLDGALRWLQPQIADALPRPWVFAGDAAVVVALAWTVAECADLFNQAKSL